MRNRTLISCVCNVEMTHYQKNAALVLRLTALATIGTGIGILLYWLIIFPLLSSQANPFGISVTLSVPAVLLLSGGWFIGGILLFLLSIPMARLIARDL